MKSLYSKGVFFVLSAFLFSVAFVFIPFLATGDSYKELYVDQDASGTQDGSKDHPFETISQALDLVEDNDGTKIYVAEGEYKENINIPEDAQIIGSGSSETIIEADDDDDAVVYMEHGTKLSDVTIKNGKQGIVVKKKARAEILNVMVRDNDKEGILVLSADSRDERYELTLSKSEVRNNEWSGLYIEGERKAVIVDSSFSDNDGNGIAVSDSVELWLEDSSMKKNGKSGIVTTLDHSNISIIDCDIKENHREGLELNAYGSKGYAKIDNVNFLDNDRYGIARVQRKSGIERVWEDVTIKNNNYNDNALGGLSSLLKVF